MPIVRNPSIGPGQSALLVASLEITAAQIRNMASVLPVLIPAPGAGNVISVLQANFCFVFGTNPYSPKSTGLIVSYAADTGNGIVFANALNDLLQSSDNRWVTATGFMGSNRPILPGDDNSAVIVRGDNLIFGPIVTATLGAGGLGYAPNDTGTIATESGDATYQVLTVGAGGAVLTFSITGAGTLYSVGNGYATATGGAQPGVGTGFTVNVTAVAFGNGTLKVTAYYQIVAVP